jgi:hypothetical protein
MVHNVVQSQEHESEAVQEDMLYNWYTRFGHQSYDAIEALAAKPGSGINLTNRERPNCMTCAEGKLAKNKQSKKDSGENSPIDRIGGVICSDLKGPIMPVDREKDRYLINFIDHKTNYCHIFWSIQRTKRPRSLNISWVTSSDVLIAACMFSARMVEKNTRTLTSFVSVRALRDNELKRATQCLTGRQNACIIPS